MTVALELLGAFVLIVAGAIGFTNAVEWLGHRMQLGEGAVGALLAAVGTALPESIIPVVALISGGGSEEAVEIAIGAIIGAPFVLATLAMLVIAGSALAFRGRRDQGSEVDSHVASTRRDLIAFLVFFPLGVLAGVLDTSAGVQLAVAAVLVAAYVGYAWLTVRDGGDTTGDEELDPLYFDFSKDDPPSTLQISLQFVVSLAAIIGGAELFVTAIESIAESLGVSALVLSLVLAPLATELPEKANSILWVRDGKDTLAVGNVTGAMAFQATIPVALGLAVTGWDLAPEAIVASCIALAGGALALYALPRGQRRAAGGARVGRDVRGLRGLCGGRLSGHTRPMASVTAAQRVRPFIGRETELRALSDLLQRDETRVACVHGIAGVGKSGLVRAFLDRARRDGSSVLLLDCRTVEPTERGFLAAAGGFDDVDGVRAPRAGARAAVRARARPLRGVQAHGHLAAAGARAGAACRRRPVARRPRAAPRGLVRARAVSHAAARTARGRRCAGRARAPRAPRRRRRAPEPDRARASAGADARLGRRLRAPRAGDRGRGDDPRGRGAHAALPRGRG